LVCAFGLAVTAQAQALLPAVQQAERAVLQAQDAFADQYAPDLIEAARQGLIEAQALGASRSRSDQRKAEALALRVAADADLARARSEEAKAEAGLAQRRQEIAELRRQLGKTGQEGGRCAPAACSARRGPPSRCRPMPAV